LKKEVDNAQGVRETGETLAFDAWRYNAATSCANGNAILASVSLKGKYQVASVRLLEFAAHLVEQDPQTNEQHLSNQLEQLEKNDQVVPNCPEKAK
jgi:hypothetical protein